jgi:hypothetical protein
MPEVTSSIQIFQNVGGTIQTFSVPSTATSSVTFSLDWAGNVPLGTVAPGSSASYDISQGYYYAVCPSGPPSSFTAVGAVKNGNGPVATAVATNSATLTSAQATQNQTFSFTGSTGNATVIIPVNPGSLFSVFNNLTTNTLTVKQNSSDTGITLANNKTAILYYDGTNTHRCTPDT